MSHVEEQEAPLEVKLVRSKIDLFRSWEPLEGCPQGPWAVRTHHPLRLTVGTVL